MIDTPYRQPALATLCSARDLANSYVACREIYEAGGCAGRTQRAGSWLSAYCEYVRGPDVDMLVWKGSAEWADWIINAAAVPVRYAGGWCHGGFATAHDSLWKTVRGWIRPGRPLLVTGHSLGGAMADLTTARLYQRHEPPDLLWLGGVHQITYGKPNVWLKGRAPLREDLRTHLSVVSGSDLVTRLPRYLYGPAPDQHMLYLPNEPGMGDKYWINPSAGARRLDFQLAHAASDHDMAASYSEGVTAVLQEWPA